MLAFAGASGSAAVSGLVAAYAFDEGAGTTVADLSGNGNTGTITGATWSTAGKYGGALAFDASKSGNWVTVADSASLDLTTAMTLEAWVDPNALGTTWRTVVFKERGAGMAYSLYANQSTSVPVGQVYIGAEQNATGTSQLPLNTWTHLAVTYDGASLRLYVNGALVRTTAVTGTIAASTGALRIGGNSVWPEWFGGLIDEVRVYSRALTAAEIQADMTTPLVRDTTAPTTPTGLAQTGATGTSVTVSWSPSTDDVAVAGYGLYVDGVGAGTTSSTTATFAGLTCGSTVAVEVDAFDAAGNRSAKASTTAATVACDSVPPTVTLTQPPDGATLTGTATVTADAADDVGVAGVQFELDGAKLGAEATAAPYSVSWNTQTAANGPHTLTAVARDAAGNTTTSSTVAVTVSNAFDTSNAGRAVVVGQGYVDSSQRQVVRTAANQVYVFACDDKVTPGIARAWKGNQPGIPTAFAEVDAAHRPLAGGSAAIVSIDAELDRAGTVHVVYQDNYFEHYLVYRTFSTANDTWGPPETIASGLASQSRSKAPSTIVLDAADHPHVVYVTASAVMYTNRVGAGWSTPTQVAADTEPVHPVAAFDSAGNLHVAWLAGGSVPVVRYRRRAADGTWGPTETIASGDVLSNNNGDQSPSIVVDAAGVPYVLWLAVTSAPAPDPPLPFSAVRVAYGSATGWVAEDPPTDVYTHAPTLYAQGNDVYVFLGHDASIRYAYLYHLQGQPWSDVIELSTRDSTDGSASVRWDPQRETNAAVIDTLFFDEDVNDDKTFTPLLFYMAVLPGAPASSPPDTIAPTVAVTAPSAGATVRGTVAVTASASDNVAVAGVQFQLDGASLGAEQRAAPYGVSWDTGTATAGTHTLTAIARDAAGNRTTSAPVTVTVDAARLVAAYSFDEGVGTTVVDRSGTGNGGTVSNTTWSTAGKYGGALSFNGSSSWVTVPDSASLDLANAMTLEAWVKPTALGNKWRTVLFKEQPSHMVYALYANTRNGRPAAYVYVGGEKSAAGSASLPLNAWSFLAATYDGATLRLYVNGTQVATAAVAGAMPASTGVLHLGGDAVSSQWFAGLIDNVRVYARALSAAELQADMNTAV